MKRLHLVGRGIERAALVSVLAGTLAFGAAAQTELTENGIIKGTMEIDFPTRSQLEADGQPKKGVKDSYKLDMGVAKLLQYTGVIYRVPRLSKEGNLLQGEKETQGNQLEYSIDLTVVNPNDPTQKRAVGKWVGHVPIDTKGTYELGGTAASAHRVQIDAIGKVQAFTDKFGGTMTGKPTATESSKAETFVRKIANKEIKFEVTRQDPMRFDNVILAKGPLEQKYPQTKVSGDLSYDYDTGNWLTNGIKFRYSFDGKELEDVVTGSIKWVEDPNRSSNGKGRYEFNLRFNDKGGAATGTEADAFAQMSEEDAFFAVDNSVPALTGTIEYVDEIDSKDRVVKSKVTYNLNANKLTPQQVVNFFKLLLLVVGPFNDE